MAAMLEESNNKRYVHLNEFLSQRKIILAIVLLHHYGHHGHTPFTVFHIVWSCIITTCKGSICRIYDVDQVTYYQ